MTVFQIVAILTAAFIAWIWIDYFRLIKVYGKEKLGFIIITFLLGAAATLLIYPAREYIMVHIPLQLEQKPVTDLAYCIVKIGLPEEMMKAIPFFLMLLIFRRQFTDPIDYVAFASFSALGFAAAENIMYFINDTQGALIVGRAVLTSVGHMFYTALTGYSVMLLRYRKQRINMFVVPWYFLLAILSHAIYDFFMFELAGAYGFMASVLFFMVTVSLYSVMLNNALNNDSDFTYKRYVDSDKVITRILIYYTLVYFIQYCVDTSIAGADKALIMMESTVFITAPIVIIVVVRLSRFKLIQGRWEKLKLELPFTYTTGGPGDYFRSGFTIKGESLAEASLNKFYEDYFTIGPISRSSYIEKPVEVYIERKYFVEQDKAFHIIRVFKNKERTEWDLMALSSKVKGKTMVSDKYRIAGLFTFKDVNKINAPALSSKDFRFIEWVYAKPLVKKNPENAIPGKQ